MDKRDLEALAILQEECAEVIQAVSKIQRFGIDSSWNGRTNRQALQSEVGDVLAMIGLLLKAGVLNEDRVLEAKDCKMTKLKQWSSLFDDTDQ